MNQNFQEIARLAVGADDIFHLQDIQSLWSGYGKIMRYGLRGAQFDTVIIKHVKLPDRAHHPRGWNSDISHQRKITSYHVESSWYRDWAQLCDEGCRVPSCYALDEQEDEFLIVLEDLDANGYAVRKHSASLDDMQLCLAWLANFHAAFMQQDPVDLWPIGTYWHLDTRPDELQVLSDLQLKAAAEKIDGLLNSARYQTFVHGDAKLANFCFSETHHTVAAVDFQYVGGGCGMKDVAYFIGSCLQDDECEQLESRLLDYYFDQLSRALRKKQSSLDINELQSEWRDLYPVAWADFHRFLKGWSPGHWKIHGYSENISRQVIARLNDTGL
jgi:hypothetical protein